MARDITIVVPLRGSDWQLPNGGGKGSWRCRALRLPSAKLLRLRRHDGSTVVDDAYSVRRSKITWKGGGEPQGLEAELVLSTRIFSGTAVAMALVLGLLAGSVLQSRRPQLEREFAEVVQTLPMPEVAVLRTGE